MSGWWLISYLILWAITAATLVVLLVVLRQLGLIYLRSRAGGLRIEEGPPVGTVITTFEEIDDRTGARVRFPEPSTGLNVVVFASPHCAICKDIIGRLHVALRGRNVNVLVLSEGELDQNDALREAAKASSFVTSLTRQRLLGVSLIPYGIVVNGTGVVLQKSVLNNIDDLEELLDRAEAEAVTAPEAIPGEVIPAIGGGRR